MTKELDKAIHDALTVLDLALDPGCAGPPRQMVMETRAALLEAYDLQKAEERRGVQLRDTMLHLAQLWKDAATATVAYTMGTPEQADGRRRALDLDNRAQELIRAVCGVDDAAEAPRTENET